MATYQKFLIINLYCMFIRTLENFKPSLKCGNLYSILEILEILDTIYSHETSFNNVCYVL